MAYTADVNRWRGPAEERYYRPRMLDTPWHPGWIAVTILGFIIWWPGDRRTRDRPERFT